VLEGLHSQRQIAEVGMDATPAGRLEATPGPWKNGRADEIQETGPGPWVMVQAMIGPEAVSMAV
jgi:hypothetical protein